MSWQDNFQTFVKNNTNRVHYITDNYTNSIVQLSAKWYTE